MGFNTGMSEDDVEEIRREYELEIGGLEKELATLRAEVDRLRGALGKVTTVYLGAKNRTENFGMIYDALNKHAKEALK